MEFQCVGEWVVENGNIRAHLEKLSNVKNALYAFVINTEVMYVGKTTKKLKERLSMYRSPDQKNKNTDFKIKEKILKSKQPVQIFAFVDNGLFQVGGFHLNLAAGLEDSIIDIINPKWNERGRRNSS